MRIKLVREQGRPATKKFRGRPTIKPFQVTETVVRLAVVEIFGQLFDSTDCAYISQQLLERMRS